MIDNVEFSISFLWHEKFFNLMPYLFPLTFPGLGHYLQVYRNSILYLEVPSELSSFNQNYYAFVCVHNMYIELLILLYL